MTGLAPLSKYLGKHRLDGGPDLVEATQEEPLRSIFSGASIDPAGFRLHVVEERGDADDHYTGAHDTERAHG